MPQPSAAQWAAARVIYETSPVKVTVTATVMGTSDRTIRRHAKKEGWVRYCPAPPVWGAPSGSSAWNAAAGDVAAGEAAGPAGEDLSLEDVRKRLAAALQQLLVRVVELAERGVVDKGRIDAMLSMGRILEQAEAAASAEQQKRSDDELAAMLERIDERIIELAQAYAERLGGAEHRDGMG
jgi:hypothetical protein